MENNSNNSSEKNSNSQSQHQEPDKFEMPRIEKKLGDVKISEKKYEEAIHHYKNAIMVLKILFDEESSLVEDEKKATELIEEVGIPVHLNMAFCFLQMEDWKNVIFYCNKVLELKPNHLKALYRRCKAYLHIKDVSFGYIIPNHDTLFSLIKQIRIL